MAPARGRPGEYSVRGSRIERDSEALGAYRAGVTFSDGFLEESVARGEEQFHFADTTSLSTPFWVPRLGNFLSFPGPLF